VSLGASITDSSGEVITTRPRCVPVPLFRSLDAAVKHRPSPVFAAMGAGKRLLNHPGIAPKEQPHQREDLPAFTGGGVLVVSLTIGQGVEGAPPGHLLTNVALEERSNCLIRSQTRAGMQIRRNGRCEMICDWESDRASSLFYLRAAFIACARHHAGSESGLSGLSGLSGRRAS
jgi:hypothetical protein